MADAPNDAPVRRGTAPRAVRQVLAVGGGRGGVGKSVLAINLGVYLAQLGRSVVLVDADPSGAKLHAHLGMDLPEASRDAEVDELLKQIPTPIPGLFLLPQQYQRGSTTPLRPGRKPRWARGLRQLNVDHVILDLGAGTAPASLDLWLVADLGLCVAAPDPPSVEATYRFCRALFQRRVRQLFLHDRFRLRLVERAQIDLEPLPAPIELVRSIARYDSGAADLAAKELARLRPRLVVSGTRLRTDTDLGDAMAHMARRYLGMNLDYVGHVEHDNSVWLSVVHQRPVLIDGPASKGARNLERIARRLLALATHREAERDIEPVPIVPREPNLYEVLGTHRGASDEEVRRAHKQQRENYKPGSLPLVSLLDQDALRHEQARVEEAHDTLLDPLRRRAYDASTFADEDEGEKGPTPELSQALAAERAMLQRELKHEINAETQFTGRLLRKVREAQNIELEHISQRTKISVAYLRAIEGEDFAALPALVYTRGFIQQVALHLNLDGTQVTKTYLKRLREWKAQRNADS